MPLFSLHLIEAERGGYLVENRRTHTAIRTNINKQMRKNITTIFATVLAISSVSLLVGCADGVEEDPNAAANEAAEAGEKDLEITPEEKTKLDAEISVPEPEEKK